MTTSTDTTTRAGHDAGPRRTSTATTGPLRGLRRAVKQLFWELKVLARHRWTLLTDGGKAAGERVRRVHLGCGAKVKPGWLNVDLHPAADLKLDLREPLPLPDGCCDRVYSEHFLEHLGWPGDAEAFLLECHRILRPGGHLSIGVPDTGWPLQQYVDGGDYYETAKASWHPAWCRTRLDHLNYHFRQNGAHLYAYDEETLAQVLADAGFNGMQRRDYDPDLDSADRQPGTLYMDARKPEADA